MKQTNKNALFTILFLSLLLVLSSALFPSVTVDENNDDVLPLDSKTVTFFLDSDDYTDDRIKNITYSYRLELNLTEPAHGGKKTDDGDWFLGETGRYLLFYRTVVSFGFYCGSSMINSTESGEILNDVRFTSRSLVFLYDPSIKYDAGFLDSGDVTVNSSLMNCEKLGNDSYFVSGDIVSEYYKPQPLFNHSYRLLYEFAFKYVLFVSNTTVGDGDYFVNENTNDEDVPVLFQMYLVYDASKLVPKWVLYMVSAFGAVTVTVAIIYRYRRRNSAKFV